MGVETTKSLYFETMGPGNRQKEELLLSGSIRRSIIRPFLLNGDC